MFGSFRLVIDGKQVGHWRAGKARDLLQYLLLRQGRQVPRSTLYEALWPEAAWSSNSSSLKVAVHMLRRVLTDTGEAPYLGAPMLRLVTSELGYSLEARNIWLDCDVFEELTDCGMRAEAAGRREEAQRFFREAAELYEDDFLVGVNTEWAALRREWLRSRLLQVLHKLVNMDVERGELLTVTHWCRRMIELEPFHEEAYRTLMRVHAQLGQLNQVRRWYELCTTRLRDEICAEPAATTVDLYQRAMRGALTLHDSIPQ
ncbi:winged helix-turn-helix domain-containing protein [Streptomyces anulatus]|nr:winged helix-turn-helix domain-containing protein [Streptomyces anulatus]MCX4604818.1 winged helix-turn-helix domain-containing protein [Streptomyces anulatus]WTE31512.1 winged helix-turn-helix domain-containing protein [Streptomyces anulatus]